MKGGPEKKRTMIACGQYLTQRLRDVRDRLEACQVLEERLYGPSLSPRSRMPMTAVLDWLLKVGVPDLIAWERRLTRECDRRWPKEPTGLDGGPPAA